MYRKTYFWGAQVCFAIEKSKISARDLFYLEWTIFKLWKWKSCSIPAGYLTRFNIFQNKLAKVKKTLGMTRRYKTRNFWQIWAKILKLNSLTENLPDFGSLGTLNSYYDAMIKKEVSVMLWRIQFSVVCTFTPVMTKDKVRKTTLFQWKRNRKHRISELCYHYIVQAWSDSTRLPKTLRDE